MKRYDIESYEARYTNKFEKEEAYLRAKKKVEKITGFYWHLAAYVAVNIFLIILIGSNRDEGESFWSFGTFATPFFWGIGLFFHFMGVFGPDFIFGKSWEDKKIQEFMDREQEDRRRFE